MTTPDRASLRAKADWVRAQTLRIHRAAPSTRIASSLSAVEILSVLYYGGILNVDPRCPRSDDRDRLIVSKGHGAVSLLPILADLGFFDPALLAGACRNGSTIGSIPDAAVPGIETVNGSLGHGLGVACGMAVSLKRRGRPQRVFVVAGDGELYEGSTWEAALLAGSAGLGNLVLIIDLNRTAMLDRCANILEQEPVAEKFTAFGWDARRIDGHDVDALQAALTACGQGTRRGPQVLIAETVKGKGVPRLEADSFSHLQTLTAAEVDAALAGLP